MYSGLVTGETPSLGDPHRGAERKRWRDPDRQALRRALDHGLGESAVAKARRDLLPLIGRASQRDEHAEQAGRLLLAKAHGRESRLVELRLCVLDLLGEGERPEVERIAGRIGRGPRGRRDRSGRPGIHRRGRAIRRGRGTCEARLLGTPPPVVGRRRGEFFSRHGIVLSRTRCGPELQEPADAARRAGRQEMIAPRHEDAEEKPE